MINSLLFFCVFFFQASPSYQAEKVSGAILKQEFHENESMSSRKSGDFLFISSWYTILQTQTSIINK